MKFVKLFCRWESGSGVDEIVNIMLCTEGRIGD